MYQARFFADENMVRGAKFFGYVGDSKQNENEDYLNFNLEEICADHDSDSFD